MKLPSPPYIYALVDPREPKHIRYIGMTAKDYRPGLPSRPEQHRQVKSDRSGSWLVCWVKKLIREGVEYKILVLEKFPADTLRKVVCEREKFHIKKAREAGHRLTNLTSGGDGGDTFLGRHHTPESKAKLSASIKTSERHKKAMSDPSYRARISARQKGRVVSDQAKESLRAAFTDERRAKLSELARSLCTPEHLEKMNAAKRGKPWSAKRRAAQTEEVRAKIVAAKLGRPSPNKGRKLGPSAQRGKPKSAEFVEKMKLRRHSPEIKAKIGESRRALFARRRAAKFCNPIYWRLVEDLCQRELSRLAEIERSKPVKPILTSEEKKERQRLAALAGWRKMKAERTPKQISELRRQAVLKTAKVRTKRSRQAACHSDPLYWQIVHSLCVVSVAERKKMLTERNKSPEMRAKVRAAKLAHYAAIPPPHAEASARRAQRAAQRQAERSA